MDPQLTRLNAICPYFTMFPLDFPLRILSRRGAAAGPVLDPFCGRGTTTFAARRLGLPSLGIDSSPVAVAITAAKTVSAKPSAIVDEARAILAESTDIDPPDGEFWSWAYAPKVLRSLIALRQALLSDCASPERLALRGVVLGAMHGPLQKSVPGYFSNQAPRTYAPKPRYATKFWSTRAMRPSEVSVLDIIERRAQRYFGSTTAPAGAVQLADSRQHVTFANQDERFRWVITSPPYWGMRSYVADQWLRMWFLGGPDTVDYRPGPQLSHSSREQFVNDLQTVWCNTARVASDDGRMVIRFGAIQDRAADPKDLVRASLARSGWRIRTIRSAGDAYRGRRQADAFLRDRNTPTVEIDVYAVRES